MQGLSPVPPAPKQQVNIDPDRPAYKVVEKRGFFDENDRLWPMDSMIYWDGTPNPGLEPINEPALKIMREYLMELDKMGEAVSKERGTGHAKLVNAFEARTKLRQLDAIERRMVGQEPELQVLGNKRKEGMSAQAIGAASTHIPMVPPLGQQKRQYNKKQDG